MENQYESNEYKFNKISSRFSNVSNLSFYTTQIKIATREYVKYLNSLDAKNVVITNTGSTSEQSFAIRKENEYVINERLVKQCIKRAKNKGQFQMFGFFKVNIVLDKLQEALSQSK